MGSNFKDEEQDRQLVAEAASQVLQEESQVLHTPERLKYPGPQSETQSLAPL